MANQIIYHGIVEGAGLRTPEQIAALVRRAEDLGIEVTYYDGLLCPACGAWYVRGPEVHTYCGADRYRGYGRWLTHYICPETLEPVTVWRYTCPRVTGGSMLGTCLPDAVRGVENTLWRRTHTPSRVTAADCGDD